MKSWLFKFKLSNALNERKPLSAEFEKIVAYSKTAREIAESSFALDRDLKNQMPESKAPSSLHQSIMRAVRTESHARNTMTIFSPRWIPVSSFACLVVLAFVVAVHNSRTPSRSVAQTEVRAFDAADSILQIGGNMVHEAPDAAVSPLKDEMQAMHHDLDRTKDFLIASLP